MLNALEIGFIQAHEAEQLLTYNMQRFDSMATDIFDHELKTILEIPNPHWDYLKSSAEAIAITPSRPQPKI